jgi:hypothetical protein
MQLTTEDQTSIAAPLVVLVSFSMNKLRSCSTKKMDRSTFSSFAREWRIDICFLTGEIPFWSSFNSSI